MSSSLICHGYLDVFQLGGIQPCGHRFLHGRLDDGDNICEAMYMGYVTDVQKIAMKYEYWNIKTINILID